MPREDPFGSLVGEESVIAPLASARDAIDALLWRRDIRAAAVEVAQDSVARGARASAAIEGADIAMPDDSPMGRTLACALAVTEAAPSLVETWQVAPMQALVALHARAVAGFAAADDVGRPRGDEEPDDALHLGSVPPASVIPARLTQLGEHAIATTQAPALLVAALVHAEVLTLRPFQLGSGLVARACVRLVMAGRGVDPSLFSIPESGMADLGRPAYVRAMRAYMTGTLDGLASYTTWFGQACELGAKAVRIP